MSKNNFYILMVFAMVFWGASWVNVKILSAYINEYELVFELDTSAMLHSLDGIVTRKAIAKVTGINEALLTHYANGFRKPRPVQRQRIIDGIHQIGRELTLIG